MIDAFLISNLTIAFVTIILVIVSTLEIIFVTREIKGRIIENNFDKILTIKLDDFITKKRQKNVKIILGITCWLCRHN